MTQESADGVRAWAIEAAGHYGAGLARFLAAHGETVLEVSRTPRTERRLRGKDDALDAARWWVKPVEFEVELLAIQEVSAAAPGLGS